MNKPKVIIICGPTASGKTSMSVELAKKINGEIISCDSMQIYKEMDIGTAKVTKEEMQGIKHYMIDIVSPEQRYSVAEYKRDTKKAIKEILSKGKTPIIVGGTGLYIDSLIYEIEYQNIEYDETYREFLEKRVVEEGLQALYDEAKKIDSEAILKISQNDQKRILRILEIYKATGKNKTEMEKKSREKEVEYDYQVYVLEWDREILYSRINKRVEIMIEMGLVAEVEYIVEKYKSFPTAMQGLGYKEVVMYLKNEITKEEMVDLIKMESRRYAKRQITWFKKNKDSIWLDAKKDISENLEIICDNI